MRRQGHGVHVERVRLGPCADYSGSNTLTRPLCSIYSRSVTFKLGPGGPSLPPDVSSSRPIVFSESRPRVAGRVELRCFSSILPTGNLGGSSPVLNLSKNTTDTVSDSDENGGDDEEDYSDSERGKYAAGTTVTLPKNKPHSHCPLSCPN
jgi:hypothetical protein